MNRVKWGIISTGRITHQIVQDFKHVPNGEVVAVASRSQDSADAFAAQYEIPRAYSSYQQLLEDPDVDAVYIATPHTLHYQNSIDAIQARKHVLCEKPFTVGVRESRNLFHMAEQSSVFVMEAMWTYFLPAIQKVQEWVQGGRIGKLRQVKADFGYPLLPYDPDRRELNSELEDGRKSLGFNYETVAVNEDILAGRPQNSTMPWSSTIRFQEHMERVMEKF